MTARAPGRLVVDERFRIIRGYATCWPVGTTMPGSVRLDIYRSQTGRRALTPRQRRRYLHKVERMTARRTASMVSVVPIEWPRYVGR